MWRYDYTQFFYFILLICMFWYSCFDVYIHGYFSHVCKKPFWTHNEGTFDTSYSRLFVVVYTHKQVHIFSLFCLHSSFFSALFTGFLLFLSTMHQNTSTKKQVKTLFPVELRSCKIKLLNGCLKVIALNYAAFPSLNYSGFMLLIKLLWINKQN